MSLEVYKASAGSGKTYQLALEYICLALETSQPTAFTHILAVTFTNKATGEMKDRILAYLYDLAHEGNERDFKNSVCTRLHLSDEEVAKRAEATLHAIIHDYDHFRVETIDSFLQSLLTNLAYELKLTRGFSVDLDVDNVVSRAVDRLLLSVGRGGKGRKQVNHAVQLFMEQKLEDGKGWGIARDLKDFSKKNLFKDEYLQKEAELTTFLQDKDAVRSFTEKLNKARHESEELLLQAARELDTFVENYGETDGLNKKAMNSVRSMVRQLSEGNFSKVPAATVLKMAEEPYSAVKKNYLNDGTVLHIADEMGGKIAALEQIRAKAVYLVNTITLTLENFMPLRLLNEVGNEVTTINNETGTFMLAKTPDLFKKMVRNEDSSFVFERTGTTFQHVMIDEFQDTSHMQWDIFKRLLLENMAQGEENMIVGDIKQSIYRWRGGDWKILHNVGRDVGSIGNVTEHPLDTNYRSKKVIVDFNNHFMEHAASQLDLLDQADGLDDGSLVGTIYEHVHQKAKQSECDEGYVRIALYGDETEDAYIIEDLFDKIMLLHEMGIGYGEMVILVRKNREAKQIIDHLSYYHPDEIAHFTSDEAFNLSASPAVMLLVSTVKYLNSQEADSVALELCHKLAGQLHQSCGVDMKGDVTQLIEQRDFLLAMPLFELFQRLIRFFRLPECESHGAGQSAYIYYFLDQVLIFLEDNASKISDFIDYWDNTLSQKNISADIADAVRIMTIHKSKGLERHTVLIPFCNWTLDSDMPGDIMWCDTQQMPSPFNALPLVPVNRYSSTKVKASAFSAPYCEEHLNQRVDSINELYVAFTRAKENLFVWSKTPSRGRNNSVKLFLDSYVSKYLTEGEEKNIYEVGELKVLRDKKKKKEALKELTKLADDISNTMPRLTLIEHAPSEIFRQSNEARRFVRGLDETESEEKNEDKQSGYIDRGNLLHYIFSLIKTKEDRQMALSQARQRGLFASHKEEREMEKLVARRLSDPRVSEWFDGTWRVFAECTILLHDEQGKLITCRPDRVMSRNGETIVIDYKTGRYLNKYDKQVRQYVEAIRSMGYANVRGFLWMLASGEVREIACEESVH